MCGCTFCTFLAPAALRTSTTIVRRQPFPDAATSQHTTVVDDAFLSRTTLDCFLIFFTFSDGLCLGDRTSAVVRVPDTRFIIKRTVRVLPLKADLKSAHDIRCDTRLVARDGRLRGKNELGSGGEGGLCVAPWPPKKRAKTIFKNATAHTHTHARA